MRKRREIEKVRKIDNPFYSTKKELDARDCFHKTGIYAEFWDLETKPNIFEHNKLANRILHAQIILIFHDVGVLV